MGLHAAFKPHVHIQLYQCILINVNINVRPEIVTMITLTQPVVWIGISIFEEPFLVGCSQHDEITGCIASARSGQVDALLHGSLVQNRSIPIHIRIFIRIASTLVTIKVSLGIQLRNTIIG